MKRQAAEVPISPRDVHDGPHRGGRLVVYPGRLRDNVHALKHSYGPNMIAVVKGDGYGLGVVRCATVFAAAGITAMAVGTVAEAVRVRAAGVRARLIVLDSEGIDRPTTNDLRPEWLIGQAEIERLSAHRNVQTCLRVHVEVDFGTGRGGVAADRTPAAVNALASHPAIKVVGLAGHMPANPAASTVRDALALLTRMRRHYPGVLVHLGGSDVLRWHQPTPAIWVRIGRPLYGIQPRALVAVGVERVPVSPAWAWQAEATAYPSAATVGYHATRAPNGTPVRLNVGFADGLPPQAAGQWPIFVGARPYVIHEVFMLSSVAYPVGEGLAPGQSDIALLSGRSEQHCVSAHQVSQALNVASTAVLLSPRSRREVASG